MPENKITVTVGSKTEQQQNEEFMNELSAGKLSALQFLKHVIENGTNSGGAMVPVKLRMQSAMFMLQLAPVQILAQQWGEAFEELARVIDDDPEEVPS